MSSLDYFENVATRWDTLQQSFFSDALREKALDAAPVQPGALAADIGAGSGFITQELLRRNVRVLAIDQSDRMLDVMRSKFPGAPVEYRRGDADALPIETATCDYVFANMYLHHTENPAHAILEMTRALKPNGVLVITDVDEHNHEFLRAEHHDRWMGFKRADIQMWFEQAGLQNVSVENAQEKCCATSECGTRTAEILIFLARGFKP